MTNLTSTSYNNISSINSTESYWRKKDREKRRKMEQIKTERILKEEKELQEKENLITQNEEGEKKGIKKRN